MLTENELNERKKEFEAYKDTLPKEPSGDVKKEYCVGCFQKSDWEFIHAELKKDGSLEDNIPTDKCECVNDCLQSDVRGVYLLTDTEATELRANPKVNYVNVNVDAYPGTHKINPDDLAESSPVYRYSSTVKHQMDAGFSSGGVLENYNSDKLNRCSAQLYRGMTKINPWVIDGSDDTVFENRIMQRGTGKDVDVIVCDQDMWFGHIEFCNPSGITNIKTYNGANGPGGNSSTEAPSNYIGGNALKSGFSSLSTTGICDVLDLVLDAPYYIDPAWFEANGAPGTPTSRLTIRWDGTTVPVESHARLWWSNASLRSPQFANAGTVSSSSISSYTRATCNGSNTQYKTGSGFHGTPCASQAYGRQYGWAYNANKWFLNQYGTGSTGIETGFDIQKIFHQNKPNRSSDNTKNPTVSSNSWAYRWSSNTGGGYYYYRQGTTGSGGLEFTSWSYTGGSSGSPGGVAPRFMTNHTQTRIRMEPESGSELTAGDELIQAGVIFCCSAGNTNQKLVDGSHPDHNNYFADNSLTPLGSPGSTYFAAGVNYLKTLSRPGMPGAIGKTGSGASRRYSTIQVGALDNALSSGKERKRDYSNTGQAIDCYGMAAYDSLSACDNRSGGYPRYDSYYDYDSSQSVRSYDTLFGGTSSACPIAAGLIATVLERNRSWTYTDLKSWISSEVGAQDLSDFYYGSESTSINDVNWTDKNSLQGGLPRVLYDAATASTTDTRLKVTATSGLTFSGTFTIS